MNRIVDLPLGLFAKLRERERRLRREVIENVSGEDRLHELRERVGASLLRLRKEWLKDRGDPFGAEPSYLVVHVAVSSVRTRVVIEKKNHGCVLWEGLDPGEGSV